MIENKIILYRMISDSELVLSENLNVVPTFSVLRSELVDLVRLAESAEIDYWIGKIECSPDDVLHTGDGWYQPRKEIPVPDGYILLRDAILRYSGINLDA